MKYKAVKGSHLTDEQAKRYGPHIERLAERNGGAVTPDDVVTDARDTDSPLHDYFEWNDAVAARIYRRKQAGHLLRSISVVVEHKKVAAEPLRAFHNVVVRPADDSGAEPRRVYVTIERVLSEEDLRRQVIEQALKQLLSWQARYKQYKEFDTVFGAIAELQDTLGL